MPMVPSFLARERTVAGPGFNRWLIPPCALAVHLCIGQVYATSVYKTALVADFDSSLTAIGVIFSIAIVMLGLSAAVAGTWVDRNGPRAAMFTAACFWSTGFMVAAAGIAAHQLWLVYLGYGVIGGIGLGIGYISPVSTLIKWFPDRPGMATGMAIMGFGGGAFVAGYLNVYLMDRVGVARTVMVLGVTYLVVMLLGSRLMESPPPGWKPAGWTGPTKTHAMIATSSVTRNQAVSTVQFFLLWGILFINVTAGIGILAQASPMMQDMFGRTPGQAAAVVSIISLFNAGGRFMWASGSDYIGRRNTYTIFFVLQVVLFLLIPGIASRGSWLLFQISLFIIFTMYGGGFATIPAFLADIFGPENVGAIHGALLTAWSAAAIAGPVIITELSNRAKAALPPGGNRVHIYDNPLQVLAALLAVGFVLTLLVRPLKQEQYQTT